MRGHRKAFVPMSPTGQKQKQKLIAHDRVHYTHTGYVEQGGKLFDALMSNYLLYKNQQK